MVNKRKNDSEAVRWTSLVDQFHQDFPHLAAFVLGSNDFVSLLAKSRPDGTVLVVVKGFGPDGGPIVCFGAGIDVITGFMAADKTIQGGHWRVDKPWQKDSGNSST